MSGFIKSYNKVVSEDVVRSLADYERVDYSCVWEKWLEYRRFSEEMHYGERLGSLKTLTDEESFLFDFYFSNRKCRNFVEIGTQYGKSTRRILDIRKRHRLGFKTTCFDVEKYEVLFQKNEADLVLHDVTEDFEVEVLQKYSPEVIFLDARPYPLLKNVVSGIMKNQWRGVLLIHDCAPGLCNPDQSPDRDNVHSDNQGLWERIALARIAGIEDPRSVLLDDCRFQGYHLHIFNTSHGMAVLRLESGSIAKLNKSLWTRWRDLI